MVCFPRLYIALVLYDFDFFGVYFVACGGVGCMHLHYANDKVSTWVYRDE